MAKGRLRKGRLRGREAGGEVAGRKAAAAAAGFSATLLLLLPLPPPAGQRLTGRAALRCRCDARCCCRRPLSAAALHVPRLGGSPSSSSGGDGGCCRRRGGGSTSRTARPGDLLLACLSSPQFHRAGRAAPRPGLPAAPPLPAPCRRLTRTGTCSPRPLAIRRFVGLLSGAQVAPAALTPALPHARGQLRAQPGETAGSSVTVRAVPRRGHAPGLASTSRCGSAPGTLTSGCGLARTSEHGPTPSLVLTSRPGPAFDLSRDSGLASFCGCDGSQVVGLQRGLRTFLQDGWPSPTETCCHGLWV